MVFGYGFEENDDSKDDNIMITAIFFGKYTSSYYTVEI